MAWALSQNQFTCRTHASLQEVSTVGGPVRTSHYHVRMHLRLPVPEGDVADKRKQFHLFIENAGWIILFRLPVEPTQLRVRKSAGSFEATSPPNPVPSRVVAARLRSRRRSQRLGQESSVHPRFVCIA